MNVGFSDGEIRPSHSASSIAAYAASTQTNGKTGISQRPK